MTKKQALNEASIDFGYKDWETVKDEYYFGEMLDNEFDDIVSRAMEIYSNEF